MKRTAIITAWLTGWVVSLAAAFLLGHQTGREAPSELDFGPWLEPVGPHATALPDASKPPAGTPVRPGPAATQRARQLADEGRRYDAIALIYEHLLAEPYDAEALFLLSDLLQMTGQVDAALEPLITLLQFPETAAIAAQARNRVDLLVGAREQQLINADDLTGLVAYLERLVSLEPGYDGHRLKLTRWLIRTAELDRAERLLREVGYVGVTPEALEAVAQELELATTRLPVERSGGALFTGASISARGQTAPVRLLIDTGATMTGIVINQLEALGARRLDREVSVRTANGTVRMPVYRIGGLTLGPFELGGMEVLGLRNDLPDSADGLLGMDVMDQLPQSLPAARPGR